MATITNTYFTSLEPIELKYNYYRNEPLQASYLGYRQGINFFKIDGLKNFQDIAINRNSCFVLTSTVSLSSFFESPKTYKIGEIPGTLRLQPRALSGEYIIYSKNTNTFISTSTLSSNATNFYINILENGTEIINNNKYLQIDSSYPFTVTLGDKINDPAQIYRQRFFYEVYNNKVAIKVSINNTSTNKQYRYLALGNDKVLRATGTILNSQLVNDYLFTAIQSTANSLVYSFIPNNQWITYYLDFPAQIYNKDVSLNKIFSNTPTNFLLDFPIESIFKNNSVVFNIANLKTGLTPTGSPPEIDNSYEEVIITTN